MKTINKDEIRKNIDNVVPSCDDLDQLSIEYLEKYKLVIAYKEFDQFTIVLDAYTKMSIITSEKLSECLDSLTINDLVFEEILNIDYTEDFNMIISVSKIDTIQNRILQY